jgi:enolase
MLCPCPGLGMPWMPSWASSVQPDMMRRLSIGLDSAALSFYTDGGYAVDEERLSTSEMIDYYTDLVSTCPIILLEDLL